MTNETQENKTDFLKFIPFVLPLVILIGVARLVFYYQHFNLDILPFLDFSEILTSFLNDLIIIVFFICHLVVAYSIFKEMKSNPLRHYLILLSLFGLFYIIYGIVTYKSVRFSVISFGGVISILAVVAIYFRQFNNTTYIFKQVAVSFFIGVIVAVLISYDDSYAVKYNKIYSKVKVQLDSTSLQCDSTHYYIGNTKNYLFFYNEKSRTATVYPIVRVKQIDFNPRTFK